MKIVLDTNVLISGLLRPYGLPAAILRLVVVGKVTVCYDERILEEYREVAGRPAFQLDRSQVGALFAAIKARGELVCAEPLPAVLPDPDDAMFLEVARAAKADYLVTGNLKHYPPKLRQPIAVVTPREFCDVATRDRP